LDGCSRVATFIRKLSLPKFNLALRPKGFSHFEGSNFELTMEICPSCIGVAGMHT